MDSRIIDIVKEVKTIAVVGCSRKSFKAAHYVPDYMQSKGYQIIPVNPNAEGDIILGIKSVSSLKDINEPIDMVNIFRPSEDCLEVVKEIVKLKPKPKIIWMQFGIENEKAEDLAKDYQIDVVMNKCLMVEHRNM